MPHQLKRQARETVPGETEHEYVILFYFLPALVIREDAGACAELHRSPGISFSKFQNLIQVPITQCTMKAHSGATS